MSWKDDVKNDLVIVTGDGNEYRPLHVNHRKREGLSAVPLEYNEIDGADVRRGASSYRIFPLEVYFQGENHIELVKEFEVSSRNRKPWVVYFPLYGNITCQPTVLSYDDSSPSVTKVTGDLWETTERVSGVSIDPKQRTREFINLSSISLSKSISIEDASIANPTTIAATMEGTNKAFLKGAVTNIDLQSINNAIAKSNSYLSNIGSDPILYMNQLAYVFRAPAMFYNTISKRIDIFEASYNDLKNAAKSAVSLFDKLFFEKTGAMVMTGIAETVITTADDIANFQDIEISLKSELVSQRDVLLLIDRVNAIYTDYINEINGLQSSVDNRLDSYFPDPLTIGNIKATINQATGSLFAIAKNSKQERVYTLKEDSDIINIVHKFYGNYDNDVIQEFIEVNSITMKEHVLIKKGRTLTYYV